MLARVLSRLIGPSSRPEGALRPGVGLLVAAALSLVATGAWAQESIVNPTPGALTRQVEFEQRLGESVPLDLSFRDESGRVVRLSDYLGKGRPVILTLVYYQCPMICNQLLQNLARSLKPIGATPGREFEIVTLSIDPKEAPELAARKKAAFLEFYGRPEAASGWHFLTTPDQAAIDRLAESVGFRYVYNPRNGQYIHAGGFVILTPEGKISQYALGLEYPPKALKSSIEAAGRGQVGGLVRQLVLLCYDYDPSTGTYTLAIMRLLRTLGVATIVGMATLILALTIRDRRRRSAPPAAVAPTALES